MQCLVGSLLWQEILGDQFVLKKNEKNKWHFFWEKSCLSAFPQRIRSLVEPWLRKILFHNFRGNAPWEGPIHFSRSVLRVHKSSTVFQSWSWSQEKKGRPFPKAIAKFKAQAFPKWIRSLIKTLLKNSFSTNLQGTGPWENPVHFGRFVLRVYICSKLFQNWSWSQEKKDMPFTEATCSFSFSFSSSSSLCVPLPLSLPLPLLLPLSVPLPLPLPRPRPLPLPLPLSLSLSPSISLSLWFSFSRSLSLFLSLFLSLITCLTQSTCWTPLTTSTTSTTSTTCTTSTTSTTNYHMFIGQKQF